MPWNAPLNKTLTSKPQVTSPFPIMARVTCLRNPGVSGMGEEGEGGYLRDIPSIAGYEEDHWNLVSFSTPKCFTPKKFILPSKPHAFSTLTNNCLGSICKTPFAPNSWRSGGVGAGKGGKSDLIDISKNGGKKDYQNVGLSHAWFWQCLHCSRGYLISDTVSAYCPIVPVGVNLIRMFENESYLTPSWIPLMINLIHFGYTCFETC